jgi:hypothetical protein
MMMFSRRSFVGTTLALSAAACQPFRGFAHGAHLQQGTLALRGSVTVPFTFSGNHIYIRAMLGKTPYAFLFDTGGVAAIVPDVQRALSFEVTGEAQVHGVGAAAEDVEIVRVPELSLGQLSYRNGSFLVLPLPFMLQEPSPGLRFGGLLGREFFDSLVTTIDYRDATLTFYEPGSFRADGRAISLPLSMIDGHPNVQAAVDGHSGHFAVDTGARSGLTVSQGFAESSGLLKDLGRRIEVVVGRGVGGAVSGTAARATSLTLGSLRIAGPPVMIANSRAGALANAEVAGNIGGEILRRFTVTLDAPNATLYLHANSRIAEPFAFNRAGLFSERKAGVETVVLVVAASPASDAGVSAGDTVITIDGIDLGRLSGDQVADAWQRPAGTKLRVGLRRNGKLVAAALVLRDLL